MRPENILRLSIPMEIRSTDEGVSHEFIISDASEDRYGTVIPVDAWDLSNYKKNPIVAYQHETGGYYNDPDTIIGRGEVWKEDGKLIGRVIYEPANINPLAEKIRKKVEFGTLSSTSVGFLGHDGHWGNEERGEDPDLFYFDRVELIEFSIVNIPANPNAIKRAFAEHIEDINHHIKNIAPEDPAATKSIFSPTACRIRAQAWMWMHRQKNKQK